MRRRRMVCLLVALSVGSLMLATSAGSDEYGSSGAVGGNSGGASGETGGGEIGGTGTIDAEWSVEDLDDEGIAHWLAEVWDFILSFVELGDDDQWDEPVPVDNDRTGTAAGS